MSDVSGIPNMGFGGGNFFAPSFSYNPQMSAGQASAAYMPAVNYAQNVTNNLFSSGGGFGRQTDYYSGLGAQYSAAGMSPYGVFSEPGGGGGASPYQTSNNVFDTGASAFQGGGGSSGLGGSIYGGGGGFSGGSYGGDSFGGFGGGRQDPYPNMSMPGGLNASFSSPSGASPIDWGGLFGGGGQRADPAPGMAMPGGLGSPMTAQPDFGSLWGQRVSGARDNPYPDMAMPGGLNSPMTTPALEWSSASAKAQDQPAFDFGGGDASWSNAPATTPSSEKLLGYDPNQGPGSSSGAPRTYDFAGMFEGGGGGFGTGTAADQTYGAKSGSLGDTSSYFAAPDQWDPQSGALGTAGPPAEDMAAQARARLAEIMAKPQAPTADESAPPAASFDERFKGDATAQEAAPAMPDMQKLLGYTPQEFTPQQPAIDWSSFPSPANNYGTFQGGGGTAGPSPFDQPSLEQFQQGIPEASRPADKIDMSLQGRVDTLRDTVKKELEAMGLHMTSDYRGPEHELYRPGSKHSDALAFDTRAQTPAQADAAMGTLREMFGARGMTEGRDYTFIDEVRSPIGGITKGPHVHTTLTPEGMQRYQESAYDVNAPRPPADIPYPQGIPLPAERPAEAPAPQGERQIYQDPNAPRPPMDIPNMEPFGPSAPTEPAIPLPAARPAAANIAQANSVLDSKVIDLVRKGSPDDVGRIPSSIANQTLREALGNTFTGSMIRSGLTPYLPQMGVTQAEFDKAYAGGKPPPPPAARPDAIDVPAPDSVPLPVPRPEAANASPFPATRDTLAASMANFPSPANDYSKFQAGTRDLSNPVDAAIAESAPATGMDFAHWKAIADIESSLNPASNQNADTQYKGLYQIGSGADPEWATHGMGDIYSPMDNALAASRLFQYNAERFKGIYGRDPTPGEAYVLHNQGLGFFTKGIMTNIVNNTPAGAGFTPASRATPETFLADWTRLLGRKAAKYQ